MIAALGPMTEEEMTYRVALARVISDAVQRILAVTGESTLDPAVVARYANIAPQLDQLYRQLVIDDAPSAL